MPVEQQVPAPVRKVGKAPRGTVCDRAVRAVGDAAVDAADGFRERGMGFIETTRARFEKVPNWLRHLGPAGEEAARQIVTVDKQTQRLAGGFLRDLDRVTRLPREAQRAAARAHYYGDGPAGLEGAEREAYDLLKQPFERILRAAQVLEVKRTMPDGSRVPIEGSGKAYPTILNRAGQRILRDAARERRTAQAVEAAIGVAQRNHPEVKELARGLSPAELKAARQVALGHTPDGASDAAVRAGEAMADNVDWGFARLRDLHEQSVRGVVPYLERTRVEVPEEMLNLDPGSALPDFFRRQALMLSAFREWGQDMTALKAILGRIGKENGQQHADLIGNYIKIQLGRPIAGLPAEKALIQDARDFTMLRIFGGTFIGPLRNAGQPFTNAVDQPVSAWVRSFKELPPFLHRWVTEATGMREMVIESGARTAENPLTETGTRTLGRVAQRAATIHRAVIAENEYRSAVIGYLGAQENIVRLVEMQGEKGPIAKAVLALRHLSIDPEGATARSLERTGIDPERIQQIREAARNAGADELRAMVEKPTDLLTHDEWLTAMERASLDTQFGYTFASKHVFSGQDDAWSIVYMLKNWGVRQLGYIHDHVLKEAAQGNGKPLVKLLATTFLLGEVYNYARDQLTGNERSMTSRVQAGRTDAQTLAWTTLRNIGDGGGLAILMDALWGWNSLVFGPLGGTAINALRGAAHTIQMPEQAGTAAKDFLDREFVVTNQIRGVWNRINAENEGKHQRFFDYNQWRDRSFSFTTRKENPTAEEQVQAGAVRFVAGNARRVPTERSLTYEQAGKAITGNDVESAAEYIERLLSTAADREERASIERGLKTARRQRSPLGPVAVRDRRAFLQRFPTDERAAARRLQREWENDWDRAVRLAKRNERRER